MSKKKLKAEKSKVKLKAKKTILPKGQNITDTNFKVKKIVIREQLKAADEDELLSTRKLNVKELLVRVTHHSRAVKLAGLEGLREVTSRAGAVKAHLAALVTGLAETALSVERRVRKEGIKLLDAALKRVDAGQIAPVFDTMASYLTCAMTDIHTSIREDSLRLLDALLDSCPSLVAAHAAAILPNFLNMVSRLQGDSTKSRSLTINLDSQLTSIAWRNKVLSRLHRLLAAMARLHSAADESEMEVVSAPEFVWDNEKPLYVNLTDPLLVQRCDLFVKTKAGTNEAAEMTTHLESLMPLLFQTWIEDCPKQEGAAELSAESADLLGSVLQVIQLSWDLLVIFERQSQGPALTQWFKTSYAAEIKKHLMPGFPYSFEFVKTVDVGGAEKRDGTKRKRQTLSASRLTTVGRSVTRPCVAQNLSLSQLLCCVHDSGDRELCRRVVQYLTEQVGRWHKLEETALMQLIKVVRLVLVSRSKQWMVRAIPVEDLLSAVLSNFSRLDGVARAAVWTLHGDLVLDHRCVRLMQCADLIAWQHRLPLAMTMPQVSLPTVRVLGRLVLRADAPFRAAVAAQLPLILGNLSKIEVIGASSPETGRRIVGDVLFWMAGSAEFRSAVDAVGSGCDDETKAEIERITYNWAAAKL